MSKNVERKAAERAFVLNYGREKLAELRSEGVKRVEIWTANDDAVCAICAALDKRSWPIDKVPQLPIHEELADEDGFKGPICRCIYMPAESSGRG